MSPNLCKLYATVALVLATSPSARLRWTNPPDLATAYLYQRSWDDGRTWQTAPLWLDSARTTLKGPPIPGGGPDTAWVYLDPDSINVMRARLLRLRGMLQSDPSGHVILQLATGDSCSFLKRPALGPTCFTDPQLPRTGLIAWALAPGDSGPAQRIAQRDAQRAVMGTVCAWPSVWRRAVTCPSPAAPARVSPARRSSRTRSTR